MGRKFEGSQHSALADAVNTSAVLALMQDDAKFRETMRPVLEILEPSDGLSDSIGELFPDLEKLKRNL
jgi:possible exonuclease